MKKILLFILMILASVMVYAETWTLENNFMALSFEKQANNEVHVSRIFDKKSFTDYIKSTIATKHIFEIDATKDKDYAGKKHTIYTHDAESVTGNVDNNVLTINFKNAKTKEMTSGFDVVVTIELKDANSYWHIKVEPNAEYGIHRVMFPIVTDLDAQDGDMIMFPYMSQGFPITEFTEKGFNSPWGHKKTDERYYLKEVGMINPCNFRYESFTKDNNTLYMCVEDTSWAYKIYHTKMYTVNHVDIDVWNYPTNICQAGEGYDMNYKFNLSVMAGDWYDAAKRYRQWCIDTKCPAFARGKVEDRKDIPEWLKYNVCWTMWHGDTFGFDPEKGIQSIIKTKQMLDVPMACHLYGWSKYHYDTHYPNWLPAQDYYGDAIDRLHKAGLKLMPYTNGNLVDTALSPTFKKYGEKLLALNEKGEYYREHWSREYGADNACGCPASEEYYNALMNEIIEAMTLYPMDAWYIDQIGGIGQKLCCNPAHNHGMGGGTCYVEAFNKFVTELKTKLSELKGEVVPIATEDAAESIPFDMYLRLSDAMAENKDYPVGNMIFSGYEVNFGTLCDSAEYSKSKGYGAVNRLAYAFVNGQQPGWRSGGDSELEKFPILANYYKNMAKAREAYIKYFNFGELVRKVTLTNDIPTTHENWTHHSGTSDFDFPVVKTGSFFYKGKTLLAFTNSSEQSVDVEWEGTAKGLNLKEKSRYSISEVYPTKGKATYIKDVKGKFKIEPLETKLFIIE